MMKYYMAPLEGITGYIYRRAYHACFEPADKYFTPFLTPNQKGKFSSRELNDILPEHNEGMHAVPQILTNRADEFIFYAKRLKDEFGYEEVNLNLGCPSKTVVSRYRGSGFLIKTDELERFLDEIFEALDMKISIKTRIGKWDPEEFDELLGIYNRFPMEELIIHPRLQQDYYKNRPNLEVFQKAVEESKNELCYNGDIFTTEDYEKWKRQFPEVEMLMLGRGILRNPGLIGMMKGKEVPQKEQIKRFHDRILEDYCEVNSGDTPVLFKMKELWAYMGEMFPDSGKYLKKIKKTDKLSVYRGIVDELFSVCEIELFNTNTL